MIRYVLADGGGRFIRQDNGKYVEIIGQRYATMWDDLDKANNVYRSSLAQSLKERYSVQAITIQSDAPLKPEKLGELIPFGSVSPESPEEKRTTADMIDSLIDIVSGLSERSADLIAELSRADKEISDIYHNIELTSFNAYQGYMYCKQLQTVLRNRRRIKNEIEIIGYVGRMSLNKDGANQLSKSIDGMAGRKYRMRIADQEETEGSA